MNQILKYFISFVIAYLFLNLVRQLFVRNIDSVEKYHVVSDRWQSIGYPSRKFRIYSAYFDNRSEIIEGFKCPIDKICVGTVRIIAILPANISHKVHCNFLNSDKSIEQEPAKLHMTDIGNSGKTYLVYSVVCLIKQFSKTKFKFPYGVGLTYDGEESMLEATVFTAIKYPKGFHSPHQLALPKKTFVVCVPALYSYSNVLRLVEFIELYKILGIDHFYFYKHSISQEVQKVLNYYEKHDNVTVLEWSIDYNTEELQYKGIYAFFHDCYYRASFVENFDYVIYLDIDEILMPLMENVTTLPELIQKLDRHEFSGFNFQNVFLEKDVNYKEEGVMLKTKNRHLYSQTCLKRTKPYKHRHRSKSIAKGKDVILLEHHFIKLSVKNKRERNVMANEGLMFHYRDRFYFGKYELQELTALKYGNELSKNVDKICEKVFANGICRIR